jgi:hypothetical protein
MNVSAVALRLAALANGFSELSAPEVAPDATVLFLVTPQLSTIEVSIDEKGEAEYITGNSVDTGEEVDILQDHCGGSLLFTPEAIADFVEEYRQW